MATLSAPQVLCTFHKCLGKLLLMANSELEGDMNDQFGLSKQLTIGPKLAFGLDIIWVQFAATGLPTEGGFQGSFFIAGSKHDPYNVTMKISENPKDVFFSNRLPETELWPTPGIRSCCHGPVARPSRDDDSGLPRRPHLRQRGHHLRHTELSPGFVSQGRSSSATTKQERTAR